jgi:DNA-directed RNA polymerase specialized sigma24 family protein
MVKVKYYGEEFVFERRDEAKAFARMIIRNKVTSNWRREVEIKWADIDGIDYTLTMSKEDEYDTTEDKGASEGGADEQAAE